jgi:hypothetical protein
MIMGDVPKIIVGLSKIRVNLPNKLLNFAAYYKLLDHDKKNHS